MEKAVFLDRDGVINELIYHREQGIIDSPFTVSQLRIIDGVPEAIRILRVAGYKVIIVSNQPGVAKKHMSQQIFEAIRRQLIDELGRANTFVDDEFYCLHHPQAVVPDLKVVCDCRKPKPGLIKEAASELGIDLEASWMVGDGLTDIQAGKSAGCRTILIGKEKCEQCHRMEQENAKSDFICENLLQAAFLIKDNTAL
ncbi:MAG: HAD family hydrolase [Dehalococcoidales bacterium]|nr:HAD family hydrolase [Dehalococcoidales bacterium]